MTLITTPTPLLVKTNLNETPAYLFMFTSCAHQEPLLQDVMVSYILLNSYRQVIIKIKKKRSWIYDVPATIPSGGFRVSSLTQKENKYQDLHQLFQKLRVQFKGCTYCIDSRSNTVLYHTVLYQTCQSLVKENLETHEKNLEILQKIARFYFFPIKPLFHRGNQTPTSLPGSACTLHSKWQTDAGKNDKLLNCTSKTTVQYKKVQNKQCFSLLVYHFMALAFPVNILFVFNNLIYFLLERFFPKIVRLRAMSGDREK